MKKLVATFHLIAASLISGTAYADNTLYIAGAMVETIDGKPVASATNVTADAGVTYFATTAEDFQSGRYLRPDLGRWTLS